MEQSQALPLELEQCHTDCCNARVEAEQLGHHAELLQLRAKEQVNGLALVVGLRCQQLSDGRARLQTTADHHRQVQQSLCQCAQDLGLTLVQQMTEVVAGYDGVDRQLNETTSALGQAAEYRRQVTHQGLEAVNAAWERLGASFTGAEAAAQSLLEAAGQALASEQRQMAELAGYLGQTLSQLQVDLENFGKDAEAIEGRFCERMHQIVLLEVGANAAEIENTTAESWHLGVDQPARESTAVYLDRGVLPMGQLANRAQQTYHPRLAGLEKQVGRYDGGTPIKAQMLAVYYYLLALHQESAVEAWYPLMFGGEDG